jgi:hypothetical protein
MSADERCKFAAEYAKISALGESENLLVEGKGKRGKIRSLLDRFINLVQRVEQLATQATKHR